MSFVQAQSSFAAAHMLGCGSLRGGCLQVVAGSCARLGAQEICGAGNQAKQVRWQLRVVHVSPA
eukprot:3411531-Lingulodinium_polyedra.AAC.1